MDWMIRSSLLVLHDGGLGRRRGMGGGVRGLLSEGGCFRVEGGGVL